MLDKLFFLESCITLGFSLSIVALLTRTNRAVGFVPYPWQCQWLHDQLGGISIEYFSLLHSLRVQLPQSQSPRWAKIIQRRAKLTFKYISTQRNTRRVLLKSILAMFTIPYSLIQIISLFSSELLFYDRPEQNNVSAGALGKQWSSPVCHLFWNTGDKPHLHFADLKPKFLTWASQNHSGRHACPNSIVTVPGLLGIAVICSSRVTLKLFELHPFPSQIIL